MKLALASLKIASLKIASLKIASLKIASLATAALLFAAGCAIPFADDPGIQVNTCSTDADCPGGSVCTSLGGEESTCVASSVDLPDLVLEIRPAANSASTDASLVTPGALVASDGSQVINLTLDVPPNVDVSPGRVFLPCAGDTPVPAKVELVPVPPLIGLLQGQIYKAASSVEDTGEEAFSLSVPPGLYDMYIEPEPDPAVFPDCVASPPIFLPRQAIDKHVGFSLHASAPLQLTGTLKLSEKEDFTAWYFDIVEPYTGRIISEVVQPKQTGIALEVPFSVWFDWTASSDSFTPIVRLRPPEGSGKPVIHWRLDAIALQGKDGDKIPVKLDVSGIDTQPRTVSGQVFHGTQTIAATVTLRSLAVSGDKLTRYNTVVETDESGQFQSALPPGDYQVIARPHAPGLAVGVTTWKILQSKDCFCGNSVEVPAATTLAGSVDTPSGEPATVEVRLTPSPTATLAYLGTMLVPDIAPRSTSVFTQAGDFQVSVDPGYFDLSIVPPTGSGYPWLVRPRLLVPVAEADATPVISLEPFDLQNPVIVRGIIRSADGSVLPGATVRAWVAVGESGTDGLSPSAVQIGQTVAAADGSYVLLLPPSLKEGN